MTFEVEISEREKARYDRQLRLTKVGIEGQKN